MQNVHNFTKLTFDNNNNNNNNCYIFFYHKACRAVRSTHFHFQLISDAHKFELATKT